MFHYLGFAFVSDLSASSGCSLGILYENYPGGQWSPLLISFHFVTLG